MEVVHGESSSSSWKIKVRRAWRKAKGSLAVLLVILMFWAAAAAFNAVKGLPGIMADIVSAPVEWVGDLFGYGERTFNPVELHEFYRVSLGGDATLGHGYGLYHATGFQFIDGGGTADNENIILKDAYYLGQTFVYSQGVVFAEVDGGLVVHLPAARYFGTTLAVEPTIDNPTEGLAAWGQLFGDDTDTKPARDELKKLVGIEVRKDSDLYMAAECKAAETLRQHILPAFAVATELEMPPLKVMSADGDEVLVNVCSDLFASGSGGIAIDGLDLSANLSNGGRVADAELGELSLPKVRR